MKRITFIGILFLAVLITSCSGNDGFDGQDGLDGLDGIDGQVFEVENVTLGYSVDTNLYSTLLTFEDFTSFNTITSDAVLVYRYEGFIDFTDGASQDLWSLIPQSFFLDEGTIQYSNTHTARDTEIFLGGNFDISTIDTGYTDNQIFRVVILPSSFASSKIDTSDIDAVLARLGVEEEDIVKVSL